MWRGSLCFRDSKTTKKAFYLKAFGGTHGATNKNLSFFKGAANAKKDKELSPYMSNAYAGPSRHLFAYISGLPLLVKPSGAKLVIGIIFVILSFTVLPVLAMFVASTGLDYNGLVFKNRI